MEQNQNPLNEIAEDQSHNLNKKATMNPDIRKIRRSFAGVYLLLVFLCLCIAGMGVMAFLYFNHQLLANENDVPAVYLPGDSTTDDCISNTDDNDTNDEENDNQEEPPARITMVSHPNAYINRGSLVLVNSENTFDPRGATDLVNLHGNMTPGAAIVFSRNDHALNEDAKNALDNLAVSFGQAFTDSDIVLIFQQGHTGHDFENHSNERTAGLTAGMQFWNTETQAGFGFDHGLLRNQYNWILENAPALGLIQRFPPTRSAATGVAYSLPGHFRYVGAAHAIYMQQNNLVLEEYIRLISDNYNFNNRLVVTSDDTKWEVYFVPASEDDATEIPVPTGANYNISGNNVDGFIITVKVT